MFQSPYLQFGGESNGRQTRQDPAEAQFFAQAFDGAGYQSSPTACSTWAPGSALPAGSSNVRFDFQVKNLFDQAYADYLSRIKTNAMDPGMGGPSSPGSAPIFDLLCPGAFASKAPGAAGLPHRTLPVHRIRRTPIRGTKLPSIKWDPSRVSRTSTPGAVPFWMTRRCLADPARRTP